MKRLIAVAIGSLFLAPAHVMAADMPAFSAESEQGAQQIEIGNNWYIRGDIGGSFRPCPDAELRSGFARRPAGCNGRAGLRLELTKFNLVGDLGGGYRFNNWFRADVTIATALGTTLNSTHDRRNRMSGTRADGVTETLVDPNTGQLVTVDLGHLYNTSETCNANFKLVQHNLTGLANGYIDLPGYWGINPYIGAGAGLNTQVTTGSLTYTKSSDGSAYAADLSPMQGFPEVWVNSSGHQISPQPAIAFAPQNWNRSYSKTRYSLALAGMVGFGSRSRRTRPSTSVTAISTWGRPPRCSTPRPARL